jgi:hypothetical protein
VLLSRDIRENESEKVVIERILGLVSTEIPRIQDDLQQEQERA